MNHKQAKDFIDNSFLEPVIHESNITDISYNGDSIYFVDNKFGRKKSDIKISLEKARDFIRQIANLCEKQFSYQNPILDVARVSARAFLLSVFIFLKLRYNL